MTIQYEHKIQYNIYNIYKNQIGQEFNHDRCKWFINFKICIKGQKLRTCLYSLKILQFLMDIGQTITGICKFILIRKRKRRRKKQLTNFTQVLWFATSATLGQNYIYYHIILCNCNSLHCSQFHSYTVNKGYLSTKF